MKFEASQVAFMGDDLQDWPALSFAGLKLTVPNAVPEIKERCDYITAVAGGNGAVREVCELLLKAQNRWQDVLKVFGLS